MKKLWEYLKGGVGGVLIGVRNRYFINLRALESMSLEGG